MLGIVAISGCTSSDNTQTPLNDSNSQYATTTSEPATTSVDTNTTDTGSSSSDHTSSADYSSSSDSESSSSTSSTSAAYVANSNTGKFHYADCYWVTKMSPSHKVYFNSREAAIKAGYVPCKVCNP